jgi:D-serine deaminase-like pyridoxal phosphate-dependent protein
MTTRPPAEIGMPADAIDTPALIVDLDRFEHNVRIMSERLRNSTVKLRPHSKTHKCAIIARRQILAGAVGICCQKVGEAEALVHAGIDDVLVSNQIVGERKLDRLAALTRHARMAVCVDDEDQIEALEASMARHGTTIDVLVEIDVGSNRCGVPGGEPALELARRIANSRSLRFGGLQAYQGRAQHLRQPEERSVAIENAIDITLRTVELLKAHGLDCPIVGGAGTGTFELELESRVYTELQAGSYIFLDADYARNTNAEAATFSELRHSLFVLTTVMSRRQSSFVVVDAGLKAATTDAGFCSVWGNPGAEYFGPSDEHGKIRTDEAEHGYELGEKIRLVPGHCDPTVNLYDWYVVIKDERVVDLWPIVARGAIQ